MAEVSSGGHFCQKIPYLATPHARWEDNRKVRWKILRNRTTLSSTSRIFVDVSSLPTSRIFFLIIKKLTNSIYDFFFKKMTSVDPGSHLSNLSFKAITWTMLKRLYQRQIHYEWSTFSYVVLHYIQNKKKARALFNIFFIFILSLCNIFLINIKYYGKMCRTARFTSRPKWTASLFSVYGPTQTYAFNLVFEISWAFRNCS
jgi:hypothetical protein